MQRFGIVDLGSNTARLAVFAYRPGKWFRLEDGIREPIRLGEGLGLGRELSSGAIDRAAAALELFSDYASATGLDDLEVIGTSALRDAKNSPELLSRIAPLGLSIEILPGEEEAKLGVGAVANGFAVPDAWVIDLGGGSAQLSRMQDRVYAEGRAYPLGAVRLTEIHLGHDPPKAAEVAALEEAVDAQLAEVAERIRREEIPLIAMGGTIRNLARVAQARGRDPLGQVHGYEFSRAALERLTEELLSKPVAKRAKISGLNPDRADIILAGALVYRWLLRRSGRDGFLISGHGVREGAFYRRFSPPPFLIPDLRWFSVANMLRQYADPHLHVARVVALSLQLFRGLEPLHRCGDDAQELLAAAAALHDIGMTVDYHRHHHHGAYLICSQPLPGYSRREQALIALLVRYHRKGTPKPGPLRPLLRADDTRVLLQLATCLRLAEQLERSRAGRVREVAVELHRDRAILRVAAAEEPTLELWETRKHAPLFERAYGLPLRVEPAALAAAASPSGPTEALLHQLWGE